MQLVESRDKGEVIAAILDRKTQSQYCLPSSPKPRVPSTHAAHRIKHIIDKIEHSNNRVLLTLSVRQLVTFDP